MKTMINFTTSPDDIGRYSSPKDLKGFYRAFGCDGLELMPTGEPDGGLITPDMVVGVHLPCISDWMDRNVEELISCYRPSLDYAQQVNAEYVVFHVTQVSPEESFTYRMQHSDTEVIRASCDLINRLLDDKPYSFHFLMENLWWPGLNFLEPEIARNLLDNVHYPKKGFMLDTGHFLHTNHELRTQEEALTYLNGMLDRHEEFIPCIRGIHLQQSLTGAYVQEWLRSDHPLSEDPDTRFCQLYEHIFAIDRHLPFTASGVRELVERIKPDYLTLEYITRNREEHAKYLQAGVAALTADTQSSSA